MLNVSVRDKYGFNSPKRNPKNVELANIKIK